MAAKKPANASKGKRKSRVPENETREQAFTRLANKRVNKALKDIALIGNLGVYPHSVEQAERIVNALAAQVDALSVKIAPRTAAGKPSFEL